MGGFEPADWDGDAETLPQLREIQAEWSSEDFDRTFMNREDAFWAAVSVTGANAETAEILRSWPWGDTEGALTEVEAIIERLRFITMPEKELWDVNREDEFDVDPATLSGEMRLALVAKLVDHLARNCVSLDRDSPSAPLRTILEALPR